jgi:hypothetical protein
MALDFPSNPTNGQAFENYYYDSSITAWRSAGSKTGVNQRVTTLESQVIPITSGTIDYANMPAGSVLQVIYAQTSTQVNLSSSTYTDTTLTASITPRKSNSKILVTINQQAYKGSGNAGNAYNGILLRGSTVLFQFAKDYLGTGTTTEIKGLASNTYLDSPNTTSSTTYKTQFANAVAANQVISQLSNGISTITLMEIAT